MCASERDGVCVSERDFVHVSVCVCEYVGMCVFVCEVRVRERGRERDREKLHSHTNPPQIVLNASHQFKSHLGCFSINRILYRINIHRILVRKVVKDIMSKNRGRTCLLVAEY